MQIISSLPTLPGENILVDCKALQIGEGEFSSPERERECNFSSGLRLTVLRYRDTQHITNDIAHRGQYPDNEKEP